MFYDVIIIGAGPGGLACAAVTAAQGLSTLVLERKHILGQKVCAGGITWNGLLKKIPLDISEKHFSKQQIVTPYQRVCVSSSTPIIATVNRERLGQKLAEKAIHAGATIRLGCRVLSIEGQSLLSRNAASGTTERLTFSYLVGADGSSSLVRRHLGLPVEALGIGITYQIPGEFPEMQWHLNSSLFANGYAWVFPHRESASIGGYVDARYMQAQELKTNLLRWGDICGYPLRQNKCSAEFINFDYRGYHFGNIFLVGDAAGLASGLTGEGIYPAIISGETVGNVLACPLGDTTPLKNLIKNQALHRKLVQITGKNKVFATFIPEIVTLCLRLKLLNFSNLEMAR